MSYALTRQLFLRLLAIAFLTAFVSYWVQIHGLIGSKGILPAVDLMRSVKALGASGVWQAPTLCWISAGDGFLTFLCAAGVVAALLLMAGYVQGPALAAAWALYLSLVVVGQTFFSFQWDILLLETALTSLFFVPWVRGPVPRAGLWLLRGLLFKLMFLSGITKLLSFDPTWWGLTALDYHYVTQPLPIWTSYYAHALPHAFQAVSVVLMFVVELGAPFLMFFGRRARIAGAVSMLAFQVLIAGTGNYGFFNFLTVVLCVTCLDDAFLSSLVPKRWRRSAPAPPVNRPRRMRSIAYAILAGLLALANSLTFVEEMVRTRPPGRIGGVAGLLLDLGEGYVGLGSGLLKAIDPFRSVSGYGLFRSMTTARPEIVVEASDDGTTWREVAFRYKPGDVNHRPVFVAPHQPRLDWQMWFAALSPRRAAPWLERMLQRILEGSPSVVRLLDDPLLLEKPPRYVRLVMYDYTFTKPGDADAREGAWWKRERAGELTPALSIDSFRR